MDRTVGADDQTDARHPIGICDERAGEKLPQLALRQFLGMGWPHQEHTHEKACQESKHAHSKAFHQCRSIPPRQLAKGAPKKTLKRWVFILPLRATAVSELQRYHWDCWETTEVAGPMSAVLEGMIA